MPAFLQGPGLRPDPPRPFPESRPQAAPAGIETGAPGRVPANRATPRATELRTRPAPDASANRERARTGRAVTSRARPLPSALRPDSDERERAARGSPPHSRCHTVPLLPPAPPDQSEAAPALAPPTRALTSRHSLWRLGGAANRRSEAERGPARPAIIRPAPPPARLRLPPSPLSPLCPLPAPSAWRRRAAQPSPVRAGGGACLGLGGMECAAAGAEFNILLATDSYKVGTAGGTEPEGGSPLRAPFRTREPAGG